MASASVQTFAGRRYQRLSGSSGAVRLAGELAGELRGRRHAGAATTPDDLQGEPAGGWRDPPARLLGENPFAQHPFEWLRFRRASALGDFFRREGATIHGGAQDAAFEAIAAAGIAADAQWHGAEGHLRPIVAAQTRDLVPVEVELHDLLRGAVHTGEVAPLVSGQFRVETAHAFRVEETERVAWPGVEHVSELRARRGLVQDAPAGRIHRVRLHPGFQRDLVREIERLAGRGFVDGGRWVERITAVRRRHRVRGGCQPGSHRKAGRGGVSEASPCPPRWRFQRRIVPAGGA